MNTGTASAYIYDRCNIIVGSQRPSKQRTVVTVTTDGINARTKADLSAAAKELASGRHNASDLRL